METIVKKISSTFSKFVWQESQSKDISALVKQELYQKDQEVCLRGFEASIYVN